MEALKILVSSTIDILKYTLGYENFSSTLLLCPFVLWLIIQVFAYFKILIRSSYKKW